MSDFLAKLAGRALGRMPVAQPRGESLFAPPLTPASDLAVTDIESNAAGNPIQDRPIQTTTLPNRRPVAKPEPHQADSLATPTQERSARYPDLRPPSQNHAVDLEIATPAASPLFPPQATPHRQIKPSPLLDEADATVESATSSLPSVQTASAVPTSQPNRTVASLDSQRPARVKQVATLGQPIHERGVDQAIAGVRHPGEPIIGSTIERNAEHESLLVPMPAIVNSRLEQGATASQVEHGFSSTIEQNGHVRGVDSRQTFVPALPGNKAVEDALTPTIQITIGRVEVRAVQQTPPARSRPATPVAPSLSLEAYLRGQKGGQR